MADLKGKVAVVTGTASGIGKAISTSFVKAGASVYLSDVNEEGGEKICSVVPVSAILPKYITTTLSAT